MITTITQQPDPSSDFTAWSRYVTTTYFYVRHLLSSSVGLALFQVAFVALAIMLARSARHRMALTAAAMQIVGGSIVLGMFGVAAFVQPVLGRAYLAGSHKVEAIYAKLFLSAATIVPALLGLVLWLPPASLWPSRSEPTGRSRGGVPSRSARPAHSSGCSDSSSAYSRPSARSLSLPAASA